MFDAKILKHLRCPIEKTALHLADQEFIATINAVIATGGGMVRDQLDQPVTEPVEGGLINKSGKRMYPIRGGIPSLIIDQAIRVEVTQDKK